MLDIEKMKKLKDLVYMTAFSEDYDREMITDNISYINFLIIDIIKEFKVMYNEDKDNGTRVILDDIKENIDTINSFFPYIFKNEHVKNAFYNILKDVLFQIYLIENKY